MEEILQTEDIATCYQEYPMVALRGLVVFPHMNLNFDVSRKASVLAVEKAMAAGSLLFLAKAPENIAMGMLTRNSALMLIYPSAMEESGNKIVMLYP